MSDAPWRLQPATLAEVEALVEALLDRGSVEIRRSVSPRNPNKYDMLRHGTAQSAAALIAQQQAEIKRWKEQAFSPLGDNHHNAALRCEEVPTPSTLTEPTDG